MNLTCGLVEQRTAHCARYLVSEQAKAASPKSLPTPQIKTTQIFVDPPPPAPMSVAVQSDAPWKAGLRERIMQNLDDMLRNTTEAYLAVVKASKRAALDSYAPRLKSARPRPALMDLRGVRGSEGVC